MGQEALGDVEAMLPLRDEPSRLPNDGGVHCYFLPGRCKWTTWCDEVWQLLHGDILNFLPLTKRDTDLSGRSKYRRKSVDLTVCFGDQSLVDAFSFSHIQGNTKTCLQPVFCGGSDRKSRDRDVERVNDFDTAGGRSLGSEFWFL